MKTKNLIGLDSENAQQVVNLLNELLLSESAWISLERQR